MTKKQDTKRLVTLAMLIAISIVLMMLVRFPLFPAVPYLEYEPMDLPLLIAGFQFGWVSGLICVVLSALIQGFTVSAAIGGFVGVLMHIISSGTLVIVSSFIYKKNQTNKGLILAIVFGILAMTLVMIPANLIITTNFYGVPLDVVKGMLIPVIIPFNLLKAGINGALSFIVYKPLKKVLDK